MSMRARKYVVLAITVVIAAVYGRVASDWTLVELLAGEAVLIALVGGIGLPWMEFAPDGAFRRRPQA